MLCNTPLFEMCKSFLSSHESPFSYLLTPRFQSSLLHPILLSLFSVQSGLITCKLGWKCFRLTLIFRPMLSYLIVFLNSLCLWCIFTYLGIADCLRIGCETIFLDSECFAKNSRRINSWLREIGFRARVSKLLLDRSILVTW